MGQIQGGYITVRAGEILNLLTGYKEGLRPSAIRLYLGAHLEANKQGFHPDHQITLQTLAAKANLAPRTAKEALRELEARNLLTLTEGAITFNTNLTPESEPYRQDLKTSSNRPVPIPKKFLETLAPHFKGSDIVGTLAHLLRCLFIKNGDINETGFVKASLVTKLTGLCERAIRKTRHWLKQVGFITEHAVNHSLITAFGGCFKVTFTPQKEPQTAPPEPPLISPKYVENAPPPTILSICTNNDLNNQYPRSGTVPPPISGFCSQEIEKPTITNIKPENLRSLNALEALYSQAVERNWFAHTENQPLEFLAAAVRAITTPARDQVRVFVSLVRNGLTAHITQAQEVRAQEKLSNYRRRHPEAFRPQNQSLPVSTQAVPSPRVIRAPARTPVEAKPRKLMETLTEVIQPLNLLAQLEAKLRAVSSASG